MKKHRIGLVGTGGIANGAHLPGIMACPDLEIAALCDIDPEALKKPARNSVLTNPFVSLITVI